MKKSVFIALLATLTVTSCNKYELGSFQENKKETFVNDFNSAFGVKASDYANHQWGTDVIPLVEISTTRAAQPNSNQWGTNDDNGKYLNWPKPADITPEERAAVLAVFNQKGETSYEPLIDIENFFVQQVYCGPNGSKMNQLACETDMTVKSWWPLEYQHTGTYTDDEVNNFNAGKYSGNAEQGCMLMWFSSTRQWSFKTSQSGGERIYDHWRMEEINGNYYVGLDHEAWRQAPANANEEDKRDYIYNDWIVKIVPGNGTTPPRPDVERVRVMCEDLGSSTSDFDYNDVVFDIKFFKNGSTYTADIILQAAGGTLPLTIGGYEVHGLFEVTTTTMVNTQPGLHSERNPVHFTVTLPGSNYSNAWEAINALPVVVLNNNSQPVQLTVNPGEPAEMIAVNVDTDWSNERVPIQNAYPTFVDWIRDSSKIWWKEE